MKKLLSSFLSSLSTCGMVASFQEKFSTILMISTIIRQNETTEIEKATLLVPLLDVY
jgi:hypothetical protein